MSDTVEHQRLEDYSERRSNWKHWGPYLSERAWGTVREDYSEKGQAWDYFSHDQARSRAYRWNEDGLAGLSDRHQYLCFSLALWNTRDVMLKERLFGLSGNEGNHGEDVKEIYYYLDSTPTHSYMQMLYRYPQQAFPYNALRDENARRGYEDDEYELQDSGIFAEQRFFDILVSYAKADQDDIIISIKVSNHGPEKAPLHVLPQVWFRNTWSWGYEQGPMGDVATKPRLYQQDEHSIKLEHSQLGDYQFYLGPTPEGTVPKLLFTENETHQHLLFGSKNSSPYVKDAFHRYVIESEAQAVNPAHEGTKAAAHYQLNIEAGQSLEIFCRLSSNTHLEPFAEARTTLEMRKCEADAYYASVQNPNLSKEAKNIQRQAFAGMLWSKQLYYYDIPQWLAGDPGQPAPPSQRTRGRNSHWKHLNNFDLISMPDKWEYPWYAVWDSAFHCLPLVLVDTDFAKRQLELFTREWYMSPNGQLPAYEWSFGDVNPPVHAWACMRVYQIDKKLSGKADREFLEGIFHKLLLNFTWWVNRKDADGNNVFEGGFLGLDNISVFDRSKPLPTGGQLRQSDGTAWMGFYCLSMLTIALELAKDNAAYEDIASKFFEHFLRIAYAMNNLEDHGLWDEEDGIYYDVLSLPNGQSLPLKVRSMVGLMPLIAVMTLEPEIYQTLPDFSRRMEWFLHNRPKVAGNIADLHQHGTQERRLMSFLNQEQLRSVLGYLLDEEEFLSPYGIRSLSKYHQKHPYTFHVAGDRVFQVNYEPAESRSNLFGGNSNWRGPVWFPINFLLIEALQRYHHYFGDDFQVECPSGSGNHMNLWQVASELSRRLMKLFLQDAKGQRPIYGDEALFQDPLWRDKLLFFEYFHGDTGRGMGASHQTGWTGLVAKLIQQTGDSISVGVDN